MNGYLRAYSTIDGRIMWEFNTAQEFKPVNGVAGKGGSINGPGPTIAGGMVFTNSGYGMFGGVAGNVLLAFGLD
jgi:polyvinyl alcohol dehydrogenase (cytochrome)